MNAAAIIGAAWPELRKIALTIGRWLVETLLDEGVNGLAIYMRQRVRVFQRRKAKILARRKRVHARRGKWHEIENWRARWLTGRIARWGRAIAWLKTKQAARLRGKVVELAVERAKREIPEEAPDENFARWRRRQRKAS